MREPGIREGEPGLRDAIEALRRRTPVHERTGRGMAKLPSCARKGAQSVTKLSLAQMRKPWFREGEPGNHKALPRATKRPRACRRVGGDWPQVETSHADSRQLSLIVEYKLFENDTLQGRLTLAGQF